MKMKNVGDHLKLRW